MKQGKKRIKGRKPPSQSKASRSPSNNINERKNHVFINKTTKTTGTYIYLQIGYVILAN